MQLFSSDILTICVSAILILNITVLFIWVSGEKHNLTWLYHGINNHIKWSDKLLLSFLFPITFSFKYHFIITNYGKRIFCIPLFGYELDKKYANHVVNVFNELYIIW